MTKKDDTQRDVLKDFPDLEGMDNGMGPREEKDRWQRKEEARRRRRIIQRTTLSEPHNPEKDPPAWAKKENQPAHLQRFFPA